VLFGTDAQSAFDPEGVCPEMSASATASASASATASATAGASATASSSASALPESGGAFSLTALAALALLMVGTGVLAFRVVGRN
jgi:hypothetical protein